MRLTAQIKKKIPASVLESIEAIERRYNVVVTLIDERVYNRVKTDIQTAVRARFWYYKNIIGLQCGDIVPILADREFLMAANTIEAYLRSCQYLNIGVTADLRRLFPIFDWSGVCPRSIKDRAFEPIKTQEDRNMERERIVVAHYYFYGDLLGFDDVDREYMICCRDFHISPAQLAQIVADNSDYLEALQTQQTSVEELRQMYPIFAWSYRNPYDEAD